MTKTFCDNCGVESTALSHYLIPGYIITEARSRNVVVMKFDRPSDIEIEICPECREKIRNILRIRK